MTTKTPLHQWTHKGDKVLLVRQCNKDMTAYSGFVWPTSGKVQAPDGNDKTECGGGLHGWPWGIGLGEGRDVSATDPTLVFSANPDQVVGFDGKAKVVGECEVVFCGELAGAMQLTHDGRVAWICANSEPNTGFRATLSSSGDYATLSSSGSRATLSSTGDYASLSSTGDSASLSSSGDSATLSSTGDSASLSSTGFRATLSSTGDYATLSSTGDSASLSSSGSRATLSSTGDSASLSSTGDSASLSSSGDSATLSSTGDYASLSSTGFRASLSSSGDYASLSSTGDYASLSSSGELNTIDISASSAAAICAEEFSWVVRKGAVVVQRWRDKDSGETKTAFFETSVMDVKDGETLTIVKGEIK